MDTFQEFKRRKYRNLILTLLILVILIYVSALGSRVDFSVFQYKNLRVFRYLDDFLTPSWEAFPQMIHAAVQTIILALLGTFLGAILSYFIAIYASLNLHQGFIRNAARFLISLERAISPVIIVLLLIVVFGPGLAAGVVTLAIACIGMLGKLYADAIEEISSTTLESLKAIGASKWQMIKYGVMPQVVIPFISFTILRFEINIRASILLGAIGAGGIGYELVEAYYHLDYAKMAVAIISILLLVLGTERLSSWARNKLLTADKKLS